MAKLFMCLSPSQPIEMFSRDRIAAMGYVSTATRDDATLMIPTQKKNNVNKEKKE